LAGRSVLVLLLLFHVTLEPETKPEPLIVNWTSLLLPAVAPLGLMELIEEVTVGVAPR